MPKCDILSLKAIAIALLPRRCICGPRIAWLGLSPACYRAPRQYDKANERMGGMNVLFSSKKVTLTDDFKKKAEKKLEKIEKFLPDSTVNVTVSAVRESAIVEITIRHGSLLFRAEKTAADKLDALEEGVDTIIRQIRKNKTRLKKQLTQGLPDFPEEEEERFDVVRYKRFALKPMDVTEAILQMNLLDHAFFVYRDAETDGINVVYRRKDGNYAVLEPEKE